MPCTVPPTLSLKSKKGCDEKGRRRRNDESREPGIRNDVPGILGPESIVQYGRAGFSAFVFAFIFFCNNPIHKSWRKANYLTYFLRKKKEVSYSSWTGIFCRVESCRVVSCRVMSCRQSGDRLFFSSSDGLSLLSVEAYGCYVYAEVTRACLTGRM